MISVSSNSLARSLELAHRRMRTLASATGADGQLRGRRVLHEGQLLLEQLGLDGAHLRVHALLQYAAALQLFQ